MNSLEMLQILFAAFIKKSKKKNCFQFYTISSTFSAVGVIVCKKGSEMIFLRACKHR